MRSEANDPAGGGERPGAFGVGRGHRKERSPGSRVRHLGVEWAVT